MGDRHIILAQPAELWWDGLPIGNGRIGAMVLGGPGAERLALNHENLWRGKTRDRTTSPVAPEALAEIRRLLLDGEWIEGAQMAREHLSGAGQVQPYQPVGDLTITVPDHENAANYGRSLDLANGLVQVSYDFAGARWQRMHFASSPHQVIVSRLQCDPPGAVTATVSLSRIEDAECTITPWAEGDTCGFVGDSTRASSSRRHAG